MSDDGDLNRIVEESERTRELAKEARRNGEEGEEGEAGRPRSVPESGLGGDRRKKKAKNNNNNNNNNDNPNQKKRRRKGPEAPPPAPASFGRFHQSLQIVPLANSFSSPSTNRPNAPSVSLSSVVLAAGLSMKEYQLIDMRKADVDKMSAQMPGAVLSNLESYADLSDPGAVGVVSRTEAAAALSSTEGFDFSGSVISALLDAAMEHPDDPNSVLYEKLAAKAVKKYRASTVVNQLGSTSARRAAGYAESSPPPHPLMDSVAEGSEGLLSSSPPPPPISAPQHALPPLRIQEAIATKHLQKDGNYDGNFGRETPHVLQSREQVSIAELRKELALAERGLEQLNAEVKKGAQWVQLNCPTNNPTNRAKKYAKQWGAEKLKRFLLSQDAATSGKAFLKWLDYCQHQRNAENLIKYIKVKACVKIFTMLSTFCLRQQAQYLNRWRNAVIVERNREYNAAANSINKVVRGFNGRCEAKELRRDAAACKIQNRWKCKKAKQLTEALRVQKTHNDAASFLQRRYRNYRSRGFARAIMWEKKENKSATLLQSRIRGRDDRARAQRLRDEKERNGSAALLQSRYRGFTAKKEVAKKREEKRRNDAASRIQRKQRGLNGQLIYARKKLEKDSADKIRSAWRIHLAKKTTAGKLQEYMLKKKAEARDKASRTIQRMAVVYFARNITRRLRAKKLRAEQEAASLPIQRMVRVHFARSIARRIRARQAEAAEQGEAATLMQSSFRRHESKKLLSRKKQTKMFEEEEKKKRWAAQNDKAMALEMEEQSKAAKIMQGKARQYGARKAVNKKRVAKLKMVHAKIIQRAYRTHRFLMKFNKKAHERKQRWMAEAEAKAKAEEEERIKKEAWAKKKAELELAKKNAAATKIQVVYRGRRARKRTEARRRELAVLEAAAEEKRILAQQNVAAQMIANFFRGATAKIRVRKRKEDHERKLAELESAGNLGAAEIAKMKKEMMAEIQAMEVSADMQAAQDRGDLGRQKGEADEALEAERALEAEQAATTIQHAFKKRMVVRKARAKRKEKIALMKRMKKEAERAEEEEEAREKMEREMRGQFDLDRRKKKLEKEKAMHNSATKIQGCCYRARVARRKVQAKRQAKMIENEKNLKAAGKIREELGKAKKEAAMLSNPERERKFREIMDMEEKATQLEEKANPTRHGSGDLAVDAQKYRIELYEKEQQMQLQLTEDRRALDESALKIQNCSRKRAARKVLAQRKELAKMREQSGDMNYVPPSSGPPLGTFIRPGSIHRLEKYSGEMTPFGEDLEANMDAMAAEFVKRENAKAAADYADRRKIEKERAVQELAIAKKEFSIAFGTFGEEGEEFEVADKKSIEKIIQSGLESGKKAAEEASMAASRSNELKMVAMEKKFEDRLKQLEQWEEKLEMRERTIGDARDAGNAAESQKLMALHATANAQNAEAQLALNRERQDFENQKRAAEEREKALGSNSTAMVSSNPEELRKMNENRANENRAITPVKGSRDVWKKLWDDEAKSYYYLNEGSNEAQWERPSGRIVEEDGGGGGKSGGDVTDYDTDNAEFAGYGGGGGGRGGKGRGGEGGGGGNGGNVWQEFQDAGGVKYWYNSSNGESSWENPNAPAKSAMDIEAAKWVSHLDPQTGVPYWVNMQTGETKWDME